MQKKRSSKLVELMPLQYLDQPSQQELFSRHSQHNREEEQDQASALEHRTSHQLGALFQPIQHMRLLYHLVLHLDHQLSYSIYETISENLYLSYPIIYHHYVNQTDPHI